MGRLLRWLVAGNPTLTTLLKRAEKAILHCPAGDVRQLGLLRLLTGDATGAADLLARAPGLGWSSARHPGHVLFPAFTSLLAGKRRTKLRSELSARLQEVSGSLFDLALDSPSPARPKLTTPSIAALIALARPGAGIDERGRAGMLDAMQVAATKRVAGILGHKRRRHYDHAAILIACCFELAPTVGKQEKVSEWIVQLRKQYMRFYAFQAELRSALAASASRALG